MALTPEDLVNQSFTVTKFRDGYDQNEVDDFLDAVVEDIREYVKTAEELQQTVDRLTAELEACRAAHTSASDAAVVAAEQTIVVDAPVPAPAAEVAPPAPPAPAAADAVKSSAMLQLALELHDKHVHEGETTRDRLIREAEAKRTQMIQDTEQTVRQLIEEAQKKRAEELRLLGQERSTLQSNIKDLRQFESDYRSTLRSYIQSQLRGLDGSPEPSGAPDGIQ